MRRGARRDGQRRTTATAGLLTRVVALVAVSALLAASWVHLLHQHPHRDGQELSCAACTTPLAEAAAAPALAPPAVCPTAAPVARPPAPPPPRAPLAVSPKQSPPATA